MELRLAPQPKPLPAHGVRAWESHHAPYFQMQPESHPFFELFYILAGSGWVALDGRRHACGAGDVWVAAPGVAHQFTDKDPLTLYGLEVARGLLPADPVADERLAAGCAVRDARLARQTRTVLRRLIHEQAQPHPGSHALSVGLALQLVSAVVKAVRLPQPPDADPEQVVARFILELRERFFEPWRIDAVADELGVSRRHFTRLFRKATGESFAEHLERLRTSHAARLLHESDRNVTLIAFACGYEDLSSFSRAFRRQTGQGPQQFRKAGPK